MEILQIVLPIFGIIGAGYGLRRYKLVTDQWAHILNAFVYYISLPALITISFRQISWNNSGLWPLLGFNTAALLGFSLLLVLVLQTLSLERKTKAALYMTALVGNTIYMGFPLVGAAVGHNNFSAVVAAGTAHLALGIAFAILAVEFYVLRSRNFNTYLLDFIKHPLILSMAIGIVLSFIKIPVLDNVVNKTLNMLGATASPVALFALGGFLHGKFIRRHFGLSVLSVMLKLILFPILLAAAAYAFNFPKTQVTISALMAGMPVAVTAFVVAEKYDLDKTFVANCIIMSTVASLISISILLLAF